jgi:hypothetical protein
MIQITPATQITAQTMETENHFKKGAIPAKPRERDRCEKSVFIMTILHKIIAFNTCEGEQNEKLQ